MPVGEDSSTPNPIPRWRFTSNLLIAIGLIMLLKGIERLGILSMIVGTVYGLRANRLAWREAKCEVCGANAMLEGLRNWDITVLVRGDDGSLRCPRNAEPGHDGWRPSVPRSVR